MSTACFYPSINKLQMHFSPSEAHFNKSEKKQHGGSRPNILQWFVQEYIELGFQVFLGHFLMTCHLHVCVQLDTTC